jgi:hypothetical protein
MVELNLFFVTDDQIPHKMFNLCFSGHGHYWIGYRAPTDGSDEASYRWRGGSGPISFDPWKSGQPNKHGKAGCVIIKSDSDEWDDHDCDSHTEDGYICEGPAQTITVVPGTFPHYEIIHVSGGITWDDANDACVSKGRSLLTIHSDVFNTEIYNAAKSVDEYVSYVNSFT